MRDSNTDRRPVNTPPFFPRTARELCKVRLPEQCPFLGRPELDGFCGERHRNRVKVTVRALRNHNRRERLELQAAQLRERMRQIPVLPEMEIPQHVRALMAEIATAHGTTLAAVLVPDKIGGSRVTSARRSIVLILDMMRLSCSVIARYINHHHTSVLYLLRTATPAHRTLAKQLHRDGYHIPVPDLSGEWNC